MTIGIGLTITLCALPLHSQAAGLEDGLTSKQEKFINEIAPHAVKVQKEHGILASITISQAILESNWGESKLAKDGNNLFGIKGAYKGASIKLPTKEHNGVVWVGTDAKFRAYPSWYESLNDHAVLFVNGPSWNKNLYAGLIKEYDFEKAAIALGKTGYSSDPEYAAKLIELIEKAHLNKYDIVYSEPVSEKAIKAAGEVASIDNSFIWSAPSGTKNAKPIEKVSKYSSRKVSINQEVKLHDSNILWYHIHQNGKSIGWIESTSIKNFYQSEDYSPTLESLLKTDDQNRLVINMSVDTTELHKTRLVKEEHKGKLVQNTPLLSIQSFPW
ncbi:GW domain-containing glycosaminoglycan-binding protein [Listeria ivanovii subsp. ivanovii]|uniref:glucosaminidase domain-containing protein n=1 Tax=Listeria ivanovii TaxID=1638 RepID=UPI00190C9ECC|nr:glucosaminidase domain-containing protein [Listeria ivanovii]MBK3913001.1 GW domain-containing glycosaminoglycan-binding protein [Listeria ivanovii subsp. ivanovii]MBK3920882.1 GW domain-containing glycosaminoglycan-binding protein [Listeria ivanovii subsp. ivanovii]MBK3925293.1 GW domain-containing glycosaminoglycan-binding protein [Listeria ivanovii subsp. ivanovii]